MQKTKNKGQISFALIGAIVTITAIIALLIPIVYLKIHIERVVKIQYKYSTADLGLLTLISDPDIYEKISLYVSGAGKHGNFDPTSIENTLKMKLDKIVESGCYELYFEDRIIVKSDKTCNPQFKSETFILLPYNEQNPKGKLTLKID